MRSRNLSLHLPKARILNLRPARCVQRTLSLLLRSAVTANICWMDKYLERRDLVNRRIILSCTCGWSTQLQLEDNSHSIYADANAWASHFDLVPDR